MKCKNCKNFEICRYVSNMRDLEKNIKNIEVLEEVFLITLECKYFLDKTNKPYCSTQNPLGIR